MTEEEIQLQIDDKYKELEILEQNYLQKEKEVEKKVYEKYKHQSNELETALARGVIKSYEKEMTKELKALYKARKKELKMAIKQLIVEKKNKIKKIFFEIKMLMEERKVLQKEAMSRW